jgi:hypothetical protein
MPRNLKPTKRDQDRNPATFTFILVHIASRHMHLDSEEDAEYIVGKAIRDGVIDGRVMHEKGWMECGGPKAGYGPEVSEVFE